MRRQEVELAIVGGGIVGIWCALFAAERGIDVALYCLSNREKPHADTMRNHSWLHSGLFYARDIRAVELRGCFDMGMRMFEALGLQKPDERGIFSCADEAAADAFQRDAERLSLGKQVDTLSDRHARASLGPFFRKGSLHFSVPDTYFRESLVLSKAREAAAQAGAALIEVETDTPVTFRPERGAAAGFVLETPTGDVEAGSVIVAAGFGTPALLDQLGVVSPVTVYRSPLMRLGGAADMRVPLFVDRTSGLSVIRHATAAAPPEECLVIGDRQRRRVDAGLSSSRTVSAEERQRLFEIVPRAIRPSVSDASYRMYAGFKTEPPPGDDGRSISPVIVSPAEYPQLWMAIPIKASLGYWTADQVLQKVGFTARGVGRDKGTGAPPKPAVQLGFGELAWTDPIMPIYEYQDVDERPTA